jgi:hypothetical protein
MKHFAIPALVITLASSAAIACPDFSGSYQDTNHWTNLVVTQDGCASVTFATTPVTGGATTRRTFVADGQTREGERDQARVTHRWEGNRLAYVIEGSYWRREGSLSLASPDLLRDDSEYRSSAGDNNRVMRDEWVRAFD